MECACACVSVLKLQDGKEQRSSRRIIDGIRKSVAVWTTVTVWLAINDGAGRVVGRRSLLCTHGGQGYMQRGLSIPVAA